MLSPLMIDWKQTCSALIPCYNEAGSIHTVVSQVQRHLPRILVIDDGSTDDTARLAAAAGAQVLKHPANRGKGAALRTGFHHLSNQGYSWVLTLDGDGQHDARDIPAFLAAAEAGQAHLVIGNRFVQAHRIPWLRRHANQWMTRRLAHRAGVPLADSQCGFRLIQLAALAQLSLHCDHFEVESEITLAFARAGHSIAFVPIQVIYHSSRSKIRPVRDTWRWFRWWLGSPSTGSRLPRHQNTPSASENRTLVPH